MVCLVFYLFFNNLDLAFKSIHTLDYAVVFFNPDGELINFLLDECDLSIDLSTGARHCGDVGDHGCNDGSRGSDDRDYNLFCNHVEITSDYSAESGVSGESNLML